jgi:hypothetical protein
MKLEITKEKVLEASEKCSQAKEVLKTLFPEAFENSIEYNRDIIRARDSMMFFDTYKLDIEYGICITMSYDNKSFKLGTNHDWKIENNFLIPTKKI